ncbi:MAG: hypothetical protein V2A79_13830 [Planctomycetota bacterium]
MGRPINIYTLSAADTLVSRGAVEFNDPLSTTATATTWIQMQQLSTQSVELVQVTVDGWLTQLWHAKAQSGASNPGYITVTRTSQWSDGVGLRPASGYWDSQLPVAIGFEFGRLADSAITLSTAADFSDTVVAQGTWVSDAVLDVLPPAFVHPGTSGFVLNIAGYPEPQYYNPFFGDIMEFPLRRGNHSGRCPVCDSPEEMGFEPQMKPSDLVAGNWQEVVTNPTLWADNQPEGPVGPGETLFGYHLTGGAMYINARAVDPDGRKVTYVQQVTVPMPPEATLFPSPAGTVFDPAVVAALQAAGLSLAQIARLESQGPPVHSGIIAMIRAESVVDPAATPGQVLYTYDGYQTGTGPLQQFFAPGETLRLVMLLYGDGWCTGFMDRLPAPLAGDCDGDGDVDFLDLAIFVGCMTGPISPGQLSPQCAEADIEEDLDVDFFDFWVFQLNFGYLPPGPHLESYSHGDCRGGTGTGAPCAQNDEIDLSVLGDTLHAIHKNATYNCCLDDIVVDFSASGNLLHFSELEVFTTPCDCVCCYDVEATVVGLSPGTYTVEYHWYDYETGSARSEVQEIIVP